MWRRIRKKSRSAQAAEKFVDGNDPFGPILVSLDSQRKTGGRLSFYFFEQARLRQTVFEKGRQNGPIQSHT